MNMFGIVFRCVRVRRCFPRKHYSVLHIVPGLLCGVAGIACFTQSTEQNYYIIHSLWHVLMAVAITCLLPCVNKVGTISGNHDITIGNLRLFKYRQITFILVFQLLFQNNSLFCPSCVNPRNPHPLFYRGIPVVERRGNYYRKIIALRCD